MWEEEYLKEALAELKKLDYYQSMEVVKKINRVASNPLPNSEGGYGEPLGSKSRTRLSGYCKIKLQKQGLRVVYYLVRDDKTMRVVVVSAGADDEVYLIARKRKQKGS